VSSFSPGLILLHPPLASATGIRVRPGRASSNRKRRALPLCGTSCKSWPREKRFPLFPSPSMSSVDPIIPNPIILRTYRELEPVVQGFADGHFSLLILVGGPGTGKTQLLRRAVGERACWIEGNATAFGIYCQLWEELNSPLVLDDVDALYTDRKGLRL